ncbi:MAG: (E)-4-hydroxy-3-methylbut-2-enyl-diphosphate synthase [Planctomycetes bacterium]|nr:(E)-4-hydroxy-3-methylbut-2-enyl-diphosphate synthase [Planctomycetota bacterium]
MGRGTGRGVRRRAPSCRTRTGSSSSARTAGSPSSPRSTQGGTTSSNGSTAGRRGSSGSSGETSRSGSCRRPTPNARQPPSARRSPRGRTADSSPTSIPRPRPGCGGTSGRTWRRRSERWPPPPKSEKVGPVPESLRVNHTLTFDPLHPARRRTRVIRIGTLEIGGDRPVAVQSMTTTDTLDIDATVAQAVALVRVGCELVRITAPTTEAARALGVIKAKLRAQGVTVPLCADIHFHPGAAMEAVKHVEKVRVNPGNFADTKAFRVREYTDDEYAAEVKRVQERFRPLVKEAKARGVAIRIGTNHGSLSDRIMNRHGDSAAGMVESAMEFVRVCEEEGLRDVCFSMKSSNPRVMVQAYRMLAARLAADGLDHPFHLGVTEAGEGEDGRTKSAIGIGSLLMDGIGDTIRVSLTEDPCREIPVAQALVRGTVPNNSKTPSGASGSPSGDGGVCEFLGTVPGGRRPSAGTGFGVHRIGGDAPVLAMIALPAGWMRRDDAMDRLRRMATPRSPGAPALEGLLLPRSDFSLGAKARSAAPGVGVEIDDDSVGPRPERSAGWSIARGCDVPAYRKLAADRPGEPIILHVDLPADPQDALLHGSAIAGSLLLDGIGDAVRFGGPHEPERLLELVLGVLQACRLRASRTEYIACPGCGRTLFDLETTTQRIKARTGHLPGVKIAVMGCIVNGPGEMADADFGYVGSTPGFVNLYVGKDMVERAVPQGEADDRLIALLKARGAWKEPLASA